MPKHLTSQELYGAGPLVPGTLIQDKIAAKALGISRSTFWKIVKSGALNPVKLATKTTRFKVDDIIALIEEAA